MAAPIIATKLLFPPQRPHLIPRPRLVERLAAGLRGPLTLISAPAGSGKTTLLSDWRAGAGRDIAAAWLSLDASDSDPARFLACLVAGAGMLRQGPLNNTALMLQSGRPVPPETVSGTLADQAALFGVLNRIRDLGLKLISVTPQEELP